MGPEDGMTDFEKEQVWEEIKGRWWVGGIILGLAVAVAVVAFLLWG